MNDTGVNGQDKMQRLLLRQVVTICLVLAAVIVEPAAVARAEASHNGRRDMNMTLDGQLPPPGPMIVSQIHNAPGWEPSHGYTYATGPYARVVSGPGWDPATDNYVPGRPLAAYQLTSPGTCRSAPGDGPRGTGAAVRDGTCVWKYLSPVDYISITGWAFDNRRWKNGTLYRYLDYVTSGSPLRTYALQDESCLSTVAPAGTGEPKSSTFVTSDGCRWQYEADIIYTSERSYIPTETFTSDRSAATLGLRGNYEAQLWNDREYVSGQHGETSPIRVQGHDDYRHEGGVILGCTTTPCYHIIITTAPGESFRDGLTPSDPLTGYDPHKGVAIRNSNPYRWPYEPAGIDVHDNYVDLIGLQIKSIHGPAVNGMSSFGNAMTIRDCILDGGSEDQWTSHAAATVDTSSVVANSLIISHAQMGVVFKYPGFLLHSSVVTPDHVENSIGVLTFFKWVYHGTVVSNTAIFGFIHVAAHGEGGAPWSPRSSNNVTDALVGDAGTIPSPFGRGMVTFDILPGTTYGVPIARPFVRLGRDWRLSAASPLRGAGRAFGSFEVGCQVQHPACPQRTTYDFDTPDIIGAARPQDGGYNIGAW